jgi:hypothetical protein
MEFKTMYQAMEYSPARMVEFIIHVYYSLDKMGQSIFRSKFAEFFNEGGSVGVDPSEDENVPV